MASPTPSLQPALPPPAGLVSNFVNPTTTLPEIIVGCAFVMFVITTFFATRLFTKAYILHELHAEDYLSFLSWAGITTYIGVFLHLSASGFARHQWDIPKKEYSYQIYILNVMYILYSPTTLAAKLSVFYQLKRIFTAPQKEMVYWMIQLNILLNSIFYVGLFFSYVFECWPREKIWNPSVPGRCISGTESNFAAGVLNVISDVAALFLPAWAIWHFRMPIRKKLSVYAVFGVGALAVIIGIVGIVYRVILLHTPDFSWVCTKAAMLVIAEMAIVNVVGCMPVMPRFWRFVTEKMGWRTLKKGPTLYEERSGNTPKRPVMDTLGLTSVAKYAGPRSTARSTSDEHLELYSYDQYNRFDEEHGPPGQTDAVVGAGRGQLSPAAAARRPGPGDILKTTSLQQISEVARDNEPVPGSPERVSQWPLAERR